MCNKSRQVKSRQPSQWDWLSIALSLSFLLHVMLFIFLEQHQNDEELATAKNNKQHVKINFIETPLQKSIIEVEQERTEPPKEAARKGLVNHKTKRETKIASDKLSHRKGAKAKGNKRKKAAAGSNNALKDALLAIESDISFTQKSSLVIKKSTANPRAIKNRNLYEQLLARSFKSLDDVTEEGYQDYIEDKIDEGDSIDLNTREYRYIGYFSNLRRSIEMVWHYPREAARLGHQGVVGLKFSINKKGRTTRIKVIRSSGHEKLDQAIVSAIRLASPFAPLPKDLGKNSLTVTGSFKYVLNGWGLAH